MPTPSPFRPGSTPFTGLMATFEERLGPLEKAAKAEKPATEMKSSVAEATEKGRKRSTREEKASATPSASIPPATKKAVRLRKDYTPYFGRGDVDEGSGEEGWEADNPYRVFFLPAGLSYSVPPKKRGR